MEFVNQLKAQHNDEIMQTRMQLRETMDVIKKLKQQNEKYEQEFQQLEMVKGAMYSANLEPIQPRDSHQYQAANNPFFHLDP